MLLCLRLQGVAEEEEEDKERVGRRSHTLYTVSKKMNTRQSQIGTLGYHPLSPPI
jgi:hypothetical protein